MGARMKKGKQTKPHASPMPVATAAHKEALLKHLAAGIGPGEAAEAIGVGRSTVFYWKKNDPELAAKWEEAVETSFDKVETVLYNLGMSGDMRAIEYMLKCADATCTTITAKIARSRIRTTIFSTSRCKNTTSDSSASVCQRR